MKTTRVPLSGTTATYGLPSIFGRHFFGVNQEKTHQQRPTNKRHLDLFALKPWLPEETSEAQQPKPAFCPKRSGGRQHPNWGGGPTLCRESLESDERSSVESSFFKRAFCEFAQAQCTDTSGVLKYTRSRDISMICFIQLRPMVCKATITWSPKKTKEGKNSLEEDRRPAPGDT